MRFKKNVPQCAFVPTGRPKARAGRVAATAASSDNSTSKDIAGRAWHALSAFRERGLLQSKSSNHSWRNVSSDNDWGGPDGAPDAQLQQNPYRGGGGWLSPPSEFRKSGLQRNNSGEWCGSDRGSAASDGGGGPSPSALQEAWNAWHFC